MTDKEDSVPTRRRALSDHTNLRREDDAEIVNPEYNGKVGDCPSMFGSGRHIVWDHEEWPSECRFMTKCENSCTKETEPYFRGC